MKCMRALVDGHVACPRYMQDTGVGITGMQIMHNLVFNVIICKNWPPVEFVLKCTHIGDGMSPE